MSDRQSDIDTAEKLPAGADHYRAFVGPPQRYGLLSLSQLALLFHLGLRDTDKVLDVGCGSLRLGRLLIPFLRPGGYHGIEPNSWLIEDGFKNELGESARQLKLPQFSHSADFDCTFFGTEFDFIVAQSIITHARHRNTSRLFETVSASLTPTGIFALSFWPAAAGAALPEPDWTYPFNVGYDPAWLASLAERVGLDWRIIPWRHPGLTWAIAGKALPSAVSFADGEWLAR